MNSRILRASVVALFAAGLFALAGCGGGGLYGGGGGGGSAPSGTITLIAISPATATVAVNGTQQYATVAKDANGNTVTGANFTWVSSNPSVATVNSSGLATGVAAGTTTITASINYSGGVYGMGVTYTSNAATLTVSANGTATGNVAMGRAVSAAMDSMMGSGGMMLGGAMGRAVPSATVSLKDSGGQTVVAMSDANGRFQLATSGLNAGFLLRAVDNQDHVLYSFADGAGVINITPLTDLMVRMWYGAHGTTADAAFANPAVHPLPSAAQLFALNKAVTGLLSAALNRAGLSPDKFDLVATPFSVNGPGFGQVLDNVAVLRSNGAIALRDALGNRATVFGFDTMHHAVILSTSDLSGHGESRHATLALQ